MCFRLDTTDRMIESLETFQRVFSFWKSRIKENGGNKWYKQEENNNKEPIKVHLIDRKWHRCPVVQDTHVITRPLCNKYVHAEPIKIKKIMLQRYNKCVKFHSTKQTHA